jgi:hypothetical protein
MSFNNRCINVDQGVVALLSQSFKYTLPDATLTPSVIAIVDRGARPVSVRQVSPRSTGAQDIENTVQDPPIIIPTAATPLRWQQRLDDIPFLITQIKPRHSQLPQRKERIMICTVKSTN